MPINIMKRLKKLLSNKIGFDSNRVDKLCSKKPGSIDWLIGKELLYGGLHIDVPRRKVSPHDPRTSQEIQKGGMTGGDRMSHHGYAKYYRKYLKSFLRGMHSNITLVEVGILRGTGLAIWCDLFPDGRVIGFDIDLSHCLGNIDELKRRGAFKKILPELHEFDQFTANPEKVKKIINNDLINICIDDGMHSDEAVITTFKSIYPFLDNDFVYFIEDSCTAGDLVSREFPRMKVRSHGELTVVMHK